MCKILYISKAEKEMELCFLLTDLLQGTKQQTAQCQSHIFLHNSVYSIYNDLCKENRLQIVLEMIEWINMQIVQQLELTVC